MVLLNKALLARVYHLPLHLARNKYELVNGKQERCKCLQVILVLIMNKSTACQGISPSIPSGKNKYELVNDSK